MTRDVLATLRIATEPIKRGFLYALIGSVGLSAAMAIFAILFDLHWWGDRAFLSALTIAAASVCGLACGAYLESARDRALPLVGVALAPAAAAAVLLSIWAEPDSDGMFWKTMLTLCVFAVAAAHLCLLLMAKLAAGFQWSLALAYFVSFFVTAHLTLMIWFDVDLSIFLVWAVILGGAITTVVPIFHRLSRGEDPLPRDRRQEPHEPHEPRGLAARRAAVEIARLPVDSVKEGRHVKRDALPTPEIAEDRVKRVFLSAVALLVGLSAFAALIAVTGNVGFEVLFSTVAIAAATICGVACSVSSARNRALSLMGIGLAAVAAVAVLVSIWAPDPDGVLRKAAVAFCAFAVAVAHLCLLSMAKLAAAFRWVLVVAYVVIPFVAALFTIITWIENVSLGMYQLLAVAAILYAAITIVVPILHRLSRKQRDGVDAESRVEGPGTALAGGVRGVPLEVAVSRPKFVTAPTTGEGPTKPTSRPDAADDATVNDGHYWEFLDRAYVAGAYVDQFLGGHPVLKKEAALRAAYERAEEALAELYVRAGRLASEKDVQGTKDDPSDDDERG